MLIDSDCLQAFLLTFIMMFNYEFTSSCKSMPDLKFLFLVGYLPVLPLLLIVCPVARLRLICVTSFC